jgi:hypothetical protein
VCGLVIRKREKKGENNKRLETMAKVGDLFHRILMGSSKYGERCGLGL